MSPEAIFRMHIGAAALLVVLSCMLIALQLDRLQAYKRKLAIASIAVYVAGAAAIYWLEEIRDFLWDDPPIAALARASAREAIGEAAGEEKDGQASAARRSAAVRSATSGGSAAKSARRIDRNRLKDCLDCPELIVIPAGEDAQGVVERFAIGRFEVTVEDLGAFTGKFPAAWTDDCVSPVPAYVAHRASRADRATTAAACVSVREAEAYLAWLSAKTGQRYRLPTEREWRHAARGGAAEAAATRPAALLHRVAAETSPRLSIGTSTSNGYGVFDMAGNVAEWAAGNRAMGGTWQQGETISAMRLIDGGGPQSMVGLRVVRDLERE